MSAPTATESIIESGEGVPVNPDVHLLIVEDSTCDLEMILEALKLGGVTGGVVVTRDGQEALDFLAGGGAWAGRDARHLPRLILLDLKMPRISGHEVIRQLRADASTKTVPVVVFTASLEQRDIIDAYELGANSYIVKPNDFDSFSAVLSTLSAYWLTLNQSPP